MKKTIFLLLSLILLAGCQPTTVIPASFDDCIKADGAVVLESYPRQCMINGQTYNEILKDEDKVTPPENPKIENGLTGMPNPASVYCEENGGSLEIKKDSDGGEYGMCMFDDGSQCEEWALFRGECKKGEDIEEKGENIDGDVGEGEDEDIDIEKIDETGEDTESAETIKGVIDPAVAACELSGGTVGAKMECEEEVETCTLQDGTECGLEEFFAGNCEEGVIVEWGEECR